jgi:hypothetical protein
VQDSACGCAVAADNFQRKAHQFILAGFDVFQDQAFDNPDACLEQNTVGFRASALESADGKVIDSHGLDAALDQVMGCFGRDVNIFPLEVIGLPEVLGIPGLEQYALALGQVMRFELLRVKQAL